MRWIRNTVLAALVAVAFLVTGLAAPAPAAATWGDAQVISVHVEPSNVCFSATGVAAFGNVQVNTPAYYKITHRLYPFDKGYAPYILTTDWIGYLTAGNYNGSVNWTSPWFKSVYWSYSSWQNLPVNERSAPYPGRSTNIELIAYKYVGGPTPPPPSGPWEHVGSDWSQFGMVTC